MEKEFIRSLGFAVEVEGGPKVMAAVSVAIGPGYRRHGSRL
jgi:hypothetical protein